MAISLDNLLSKKLIPRDSNFQPMAPIVGLDPATGNFVPISLEAVGDGTYKLATTASVSLDSTIGIENNASVQINPATEDTLLLIKAQVNNFTFSGTALRTDINSMPAIVGTVDVNNFPALQVVDVNSMPAIVISAVDINSMPAITGTVDINNFPSVQTVDVNSMPAVTVSGLVDVNNFPANQLVTVNNFPSVQSVDVNSMPSVSISGSANTYYSDQAVTALTASYQTFTFGFTSKNITIANDSDSTDILMSYNGTDTVMTIKAGEIFAMDYRSVASVQLKGNGAAYRLMVY